MKRLTNIPASGGRKSPAVPETLTLVAAAVLLALAHASSVRADWPLIRGDANATGASSDKLRAPLDILWTYESEDGAAFEATAAIVDGVVYVGDVEGTFHAVKLADGAPVWTRKFEETGFVAGTAVAHDRVYCVDYNGNARALSVKDGEPVWEVATETSLYAAPNVHDDLTLIATESGELLALDSANGDQRWKFAIDQPLRAWPTVVGGRVLVAGCDGKLHAVDVATGEAVESIDIGGPADAMPAVLGDRVYFCTAGGVFHAMTIKPLAPVWKYGQRDDGEVIHAAAVTERAVVLGTHDKRVVALDPATGDEIWTFPLRSRAESSPVVVGNLALAATIRGRFHAIDMKSGKSAWETDLGSRFTASPAVSDGRVVIGNEDGTLYCFGAKQ